MAAARGSRGGAGMHRSEAEGRFGEAEPDGRASVCAEALCQPSELSLKMRKALQELDKVGIFHDGCRA